jgi:uncharacterized protein YjiK
MARESLIATTMMIETRPVHGVLICALLLWACGQSAPTAPPQSAASAPRQGHSLFADAPDKQWRLPERLAEISGLAATADGRLFGHDDERAIIYELDVESGRIVKNFALGAPLSGDFEGIAITAAGEFYLTTSTGTLYRFREADDGAHAAFDTLDTGLADVCEIEGLAFDETRQALILACKAMLARAMRDSIALYLWPVAESTPALLFTLPAAEAANAAGVRDFHPSSVERDAASGRLVLLAAREGGLVELNDQGAVVAGRRLGRRHPQAEGAAITPDGALVIADEAGPDGRALISRYPRLP